MPNKSVTYYICDVFTQSQFGGNQLAVIPDAAGLSDVQMQKIAAEFNFPETTFVLPVSEKAKQAGCDFQVRIFTPTQELPFAGHPNLGTAFVLHQAGLLAGERQQVIFDELAGKVAIEFIGDGKEALRYQLTSPESFSRKETVDVELVAGAIGLSANDITLENHQPVVASVGLPFIFVELNNLQALAAVTLNLSVFQQLAHPVHVYAKQANQRIQARMFAPMLGVNEDPATGSANCALAALLAELDNSESGQFNWQVTQGVEMGRESELFISAHKNNGLVTSAKVAGHCVLVSKGEFFLST
ncbi:phenazine biosynthesis protein PhzF [Saccharobesus litoralis]|uniref:Phenazine biosynthesis protein PhzF n=1 Tax=Saccharobesus litoralis TaxID=2172099 RepID=A0A2S0VQ03_9ALTE|nr:PhzF family phenazine biosynthesis protein [Saccharobesus litoralis]AWB66284.1 phenazine biosynthesis protein PhzF [Saccharobesus litoralis]